MSMPYLGKSRINTAKGATILFSKIKQWLFIKELVKLLGFNTPKTNIGELFPTKTPDLSEQQKPIYQCIKNNHKITLDDLSEKMKISTFELLPILLEMEILGVIQSFSGRQFSVS